MTTEETGAIQISIGSFFPMLLLSGILWPLESIPTGLRYFAYILPTTWSAEAMRSLMLRGWGMDHMQVRGFPL
jgi:ABC-type multidrug transport system permease subunit